MASGKVKLSEHSGKTHGGVPAGPTTKGGVPFRLS